MTETNSNELIFILYIADQERSKNFYSQVLGTEPVLHVPGMTEFQLTESAKLGLMPETGNPPSRVRVAGRRPQKSQPTPTRSAKPSTWVSTRPVTSSASISASV